MRIARQCVYQCLARIDVIPVAVGLARRDVVIVALEAAATLSSKFAGAAAQQGTNGRANERHCVLRCDRVVERRRVEHSLAANQSYSSRDVERGLEDSIGARRTSQALSHVDQNRVREA